MHPTLDRRIRLLARRGVAAAEIRRLLRPRAAALDVSVPCYTRILETVRAERLRAATEGRGRIAVAGVFYGRIPAPLATASAAGAGAHVHKRLLFFPRPRRDRLRQAA